MEPIPTFSIIVPTFGRPAFLMEALQSIRDQSNPDFECIVVDDASPEPVELPIDDPRFRLVRHTSNRGPAAARNTGLAAARGRIVGFLDDDDLFGPQRLEDALAPLERSPITVCAAWRVGSDQVNMPTIAGHTADVILDATPPSICQTMVLRAVCPLFDERFIASEDTEWWLRASRVGEVTPTTRPGCGRRVHDGPRLLHGAPARLASNLQLLDEYADYFSSHSRAAAYRWIRVGWLARDTGDRRQMWKAVRRAMATDRSVRTWGRAVRLMAGRR